MYYKSMLVGVVALLVIPVVAAKETKVETEVRSVIVYPGQAKVTRVVNLDLDAGSHAVIVENLPGGAVGGSLRASAFGVEGITLLGLSHSRQEHREAPNRKVAELEKELDRLQGEQKQSVVDRLAAFDQLKKFVGSLSSGAATAMSRQVAEGGLDVSQWSAAYAFVGEKNFSLGDSVRLAQQEMNEIDSRIHAVRSELHKLSTTHRRITKTVQVDLDLVRAGKVELTIEYVTPGAQWKPLYDARIGDDPDQVQFTYYAEVSQKTGEDWSDVELTLSTARPSLGAGPGELSPWFLAVDARYQPVYSVDALMTQVSGVQTTSSGEIFVRGGRAAKVGYLTDGVPLGEPLGGQSGLIAAEASVRKAALSSGAYPATFMIKRQESVPSGDKAVRVTVAEWQFDGKTKLIARPRLRSGAYRLVTLHNQDTAPLMSGSVAIFAGTHFLGHTQFSQLIAPGQEFNLPFGLDNHVTVEREVLSFKKSSKGKKVQIDQTIQITLHNYGDVARTIELEETIPVTRDSRIKVKIGKILPEPNTKDERGNLTWTIDLAPDSEIVVTVPYRVTHPNGLPIAGL